MLTKVEVRTSQGALLSLPLDDISTGLLVESIEGLDPVKATLVSSSFARLNGEQYHSSRRETRNIKFRLNLEPDYVSHTVQDLRKRLYAFFMPKSVVNMKFHMSEGLVVDIQGRVESFETPLFTKDPAVDISVICFDSDFIDSKPVVIYGMSTANGVMNTLTYSGSIETGIRFMLYPKRPLSEFTFYHIPPDGSIRSLDFSTPLIASDILEVTTVVGSKGAYRSRANVKSSVLYGVSPQSNWIELTPGDNQYRIYAEGVGIPYTIEYTTKYGGL